MLGEPRRSDMDLAALSGCLSEIQSSLEQASSRWRRAVSGGASLTPDAAQKIGQALTEALGGLRFAALETVARVLEAVHQLIAQSAQAPDGLGPQALVAIEAGLDAIDEWLHHARQGQTLPAMALWPAYSALRRSLGDALADPGDLFDAPLRQGVPSELPISALSATQAATVQAALERSLLGLLRNVQDARAQSSLVASLGRMAQAPSPDDLRNTWWLAAAAADALRRGCLPAEPEVMRPMIRVVDRLRRHLRDAIDGASPTEAQVAIPRNAPHEAAPDWSTSQRSLLALIARSAPGSPWADRVRKDNALDAWISDTSGDARLGLSDPRARDQALEAVAMAKAGWASVCAGERAEMGAFGSALQRLDAALARLPYIGLQAVSEGLLGLRRRLGERRGAPSDPVALEVATTILFVEWALRRRGGPVPGLDARCAEIRSRIDPLPSWTGASRPWPDWLQELARVDQAADTHAALERGLRANLQGCEQVLEAFFHQPDQHEGLSAVVAQLTQSAGVLSVLGCDAPAAVLGAMAQRVRSCLEGGAPPDAGEQEQMVAQLGAFGLGMLSGRGPSTLPRTWAGEQAEVGLGPSLGCGAVSDATPWAGASEAPETLDPSLRQVFLSEARRLLEQMHAVLATASAREHTDAASQVASEPPLAVGWVDALFRTVHTLRGSVCTAGASALEAILHGMESRLAAARARQTARPHSPPSASAPLLVSDTGQDQDALLAALSLDLERLALALAALDADSCGPAAGASHGASDGSFAGTFAGSALTPRIEPAPKVDAPLRFAQLADRLHRVVRQASRDAGRPAMLVIDGEQTPLTAPQAAGLPDLLGHLIRNAIAHGIEDAEIRQACGKAALGQILLRLRTEPGVLCLELSDDGRGPDFERIRACAQALGLASEDDPALLLPLLFHPGLSTSHEISALAGRGVGLDAVRAQVLALGGEIALSVPPQRGLTITIRLPDLSTPDQTRLTTS
jgi:hypothetical protein